MEMYLSNKERIEIENRIGEIIRNDESTTIDSILKWVLEIDV